MKFKKYALLSLVLVFALPAVLHAAETKSQEKKKFQASSLWGVRRGPNAPQKPVKAEPSETEKEEEKRKKNMEAMNEERAKSAYLNSLSTGARGTKTVSTGSAECAAPKK